MQQATINISQSVMQAIIACGLAADKRRTSSVLSGIYFQVKDGIITTAATDGKILVEHKNKLETDTTDMQFIIPWQDKDLQRVFKAAAKIDTAVTLTVDVTDIKEYQLTLTHGSVSFAFRPSHGTYPAYHNALNDVKYDAQLACVPVLDADYLSLLPKALLLPKHTKSIVMFSSKKDSRGPQAIIIKSVVASHNARALIMPTTSEYNACGTDERTDAECAADYCQQDIAPV